MEYCVETHGFTNIATFFLAPVLMMPTVFCLILGPFANKVWGYQGISIGLAMSITFLTVTGYVYRKSLILAGRLLTEREQLILDILLRDRD